MATIRLSRSAFFHNLDIIAHRSGSVDKIAVVLKDNAYGHGLREMAALASEYGIRRAVVRTSEEAEAIDGYFEYILVLSDIPAEASPTVCYTVNALEQIARFPSGTKVELKVDTGMHRNGIAGDELEAAFSAVRKAGLSLEGVFTHFSSADTSGPECAEQAKAFASVKAEAKALAVKYGVDPLHFHSANSAGTFRALCDDEDMVRVGIAAYGCLVMESTLEQHALRPVLSLWADKIATRSLKKGERIGYNGTYEASDEMVVSSYDVGYADGLLRSASNRYTTPTGKKLLGRVSMDNTSFTGSEAELLIFENANDYADAAGSIGYEVLVGMRPHMKRIVGD